MGLHRKVTVTPVGGTPIPVNPKAGKKESTCRAVAKSLLEVEWEKQSEREWIRRHNQTLDESFDTGGEITLYSALSFYGETFSPATDPLASNPTAGEMAAAYPNGIPGSARRPSSNNVPGTPGWTPHTGLEEVEKHKIDKVKDKVKGNVRTKVIEGKNPKVEVLKRKKNKTFPEGTGPHDVGDLVQGLIDDTELTGGAIDDVEVAVPHWDFNEYTLAEALDVCAKVGGANYNVDANGELNFFLPDARPHPRPATSAPFGGAEFEDGYVFKGGEGSTIVDGEPNPIQKGTIERTKDSSGMVNRGQLMNGGDESEERVEEFGGDDFQDEFHTTYEPVFCTITVSISPNGVLPFETLSLYQDWGDRPLLSDSYPAAPYDSPQCGPLGDLADPICYVNTKEKSYRLVDSGTGAAVPLAAGAVFRVQYKHLDPVYAIIEDPESIAEHGLVEKMYVFPDRQRIEQARMLVEAEVNDFSQPITNLKCNVFDDVYRVGDSVRFIIPELGMDEYLIVYEVERTWDMSLRGTDQDPGWSTLIKAGSKLPIKLSDILKGMNKRISALERVYNMTDLNASTGFLTPIQYDQLMKEEFKF